MKENLSTILLMIGIITPSCAFIVFWVGKLLNLRQEIIELQMKDQFKDQIIKDMQKDIEQLQEQWNRVRG